MKIKTSELQGAALDWAVAYATNRGKVFSDVFGDRMLGRKITCSVISGHIAPSTDWSQCGPLIEGMAVMMQTFSKDHDMKWQAKCENNYGFGENPLIAACRAIVAAKLGDKVDVPEELV